MKRSSSVLLALTLGAVIALASSSSAMAAESEPPPIAAHATQAEPAAAPSANTIRSGPTATVWTERYALPRGVQEATKKRMERRSALRWC